MGRLMQQNTGRLQQNSPTKTDNIMHGITEGSPASSETGRFISGVGQDIQKRTSNVENIIDTSHQRTFPESALQIAGQAAGGVFDIAGRGLSTLTPDIIEKPIVKAIASMARTKPIQQVVKVYQDFRKKHPRAAADLEAGVNLISALGLPSAGRATGKPVSVLGKSIEKSGQSGLLEEKNAFVKRLIRPLETTAVKEEQVRRTIEVGSGPFRHSVVTPTFLEAKAQKAVLEVPGIEAAKTYQQNYNIIKEYNINLAKKLESDLIKNDFIYPKKELLSRLKETKTELARNPLLVGDNEKIASKLISELERRIDTSGAKGSTLLQIRKDFDRWLESQKPKIFDAKSESALTFTSGKIRQTVNDFLEAKAPQVKIKESFARQSALFNAMDTIIPKAAQEANTAAGRVFQHMMQALGIKNKLVQQIAAVAGIGGLGAAATFAPMAAVLGVGGYTIYRAGKFVLNPRLRIYTGKLLQEYGRVAGGQAMLQARKEIEKILK